MPVTEGKYQCKICEDVFEAKTGVFTKCQCGESEIDPHSFGYSYRNGNRVNTIEQNTYYLEDEFMKFPEDIQATYDQIKKIKEDNGYKYYLYEMTSKGESGEEYLHQINFTYNESNGDYWVEHNEISLTISLKKDEYKGDEVTRKRLQRLLDIMNQIESGESVISNRSKMVDLAEKEDIDYREEPTGHTNYKFYF